MKLEETKTTNTVSEPEKKKDNKAKDKKGFSFNSWFGAHKAEFKKIVWPDQKSLTKETAAVVIVSVVVGVIISVVDLIARFGIEFLVK